MNEQYDDPRVASRASLMFQLAGYVDPTRPNFELADRLRAENQRDFPVLSPADAERLERAVRRATGT